MGDLYLAHYGVKGQKWGVRRYQNPDGSLTEEGRVHYGVGSAKKSRLDTPKNTIVLKDYAGPAYFISSNPQLKSLSPRVPQNYFTEHGYEDSDTPRVSFAPSVDKCLAGLSQNVEGQTFTVYSPSDISKHTVYKPNSEAVPDADITDELWICENVDLKRLGTITVTGNRGQEGHKFSYGNKQAELYDDWIYDSNFTKHADEDAVDDLYLAHYGVKYQRWGIRKYQRPDGSLTPLGRIHYGIGPGRFTKRNDFPSPYDGGVLKKGTLIRSVAGDVTDAEEHIRQGRWLYGYNPQDSWDRKVYTGYFPKDKLKFDGADVISELEYKTVKDLKMPSRQDRVNVLKRMYKDESTKDSIVKALDFWQWWIGRQDFRPGSDAMYEVDVTNPKTKEDWDNVYDLLSFTIHRYGYHDDDRLGEYVNRLSSKYGAMVDDTNLDAYNGVNNPIVIFDTENLISTHGKDPVSIISDDEMNKKEDQVYKRMRKVAMKEWRQKEKQRKKEEKKQGN